MKHNYIKTLVACFIAVAVFASSCQKENGVDNLGGEATVTINMQGVGPSTGNKAKAGLRASASAGTVATPAVQRQVVKFNNQFNVTATLREVTPTTATVLRASANRAETTATGAGDILPLADGTTYTVVISQGGEVLTTETFTQGEGEHKFNIEAGSYTYVAYAYGDASASGADQDPLWVSGSFSVTAGENNTLSIVLEHKLTEVTVVFNAGSGRTINAIGAGTLAPNHNYTFNEGTGAVTFGAATTAAAVSFSGQTAGQTWTSNPTMIAVEDTDNGVVELSNVTINNTPGSITSDGWALRAGVQYRLELNLGDKEDEGIEVGGSVWSSGNLVYDWDNDKYGFTGSNGIVGDYFFSNYVRPKKLDGSNQGANTEINGLGGDPCALVAPVGTWRLPTTTEIQALITRTGQGGADNPGPNPWSSPARWITRYDADDTSSQIGLFFGVLTDPQFTHPGAQREDYLFFSFGGYYSNDNDNPRYNDEMAYLLLDETASGAARYSKIFHSADDPESAAWGASISQNFGQGAVQIRCVQN